MRVEITKLTSWNDVLNAARFTQRKLTIDKEPSDNFKRNIIKAEHSPLRSLIFNIDLYDIPRFVSDHLVRHVHAQPYVSTGRSDVLEENLPRDEQKMTDLYNTRLLLNAQEIINISRIRLCNHAEKETIQVWKMVRDKLREIGEEILANACVPSCIYRCGFCPEIKSCGYNKTNDFEKNKELYLKNFEHNKS